MRTALEKHLFIGDLHIPDYNVKSLELLFAFIPNLAPDKIHILGDFVNFTKVSKYDADPYYHTSLKDEIDEARKILERLVKTARKANRKAEITWLEGNHELRLIKFLGRHAEQLAELDIEEERVLSIPHLFGLRKLGVKWIPTGRVVMEGGDTIIEHGDTARKYAGYTARAMQEKRGSNGISGHCHRMAFYTRNVMGKIFWWIENGCLCNLKPTPAYVLYPDWIQGISVGYYSKKTRTMYPVLIPILSNSFVFNGKLYE